MNLSMKFIDAFLNSYRECRFLFADTEWIERVWKEKEKDGKENWNHFMLWNSRRPQDKPLLKIVAEKMDLNYWDREPFRLDAVFLENAFEEFGNIPVPIVVGIEHELNVNSFHEEIAKLFHIRCPLKVGITYVPSYNYKKADLKKWQGRILEWTGRIARLSGRFVQEDSGVEYTYILGAEEKEYELEWYEVTFKSSSLPRIDEWKLI